MACPLETAKERKQKCASEVQFWFDFFKLSLPPLKTSRESMLIARLRVYANCLVFTLQVNFLRYLNRRFRIQKLVAYGLPMSES